MSLLQIVTEFLIKGKDLFQRMRSPEGTSLSKGDLHLLKEQLQALHAEVVNLLKQKEGRD